MVRKRTKFRKVNLIAIVLALSLCGALSLAVPVVRETIVFRYDQARIYLRYKLFPPEEAVFIPQQQVELATLQPSPTTAATPTHTPAPTLFIEPTATPLPSATPTLTYTPGPPKVLLEGGKYIHQHGLWNYCGPANLSMALSFWGLNADRLVVGDYLKPFREDKSVRAYEMIDYIVNQTDLYVALRYGGTPELLKTLLANGFPVLIEKGIFMEESISHRIVWAGHYNMVVGYDDEARRFITRDSYYSPPDYPLDYPISYDEILTEWRGFNYTFLVIYPVEKS